jgi:hypothetical protein
MPLICSEVYVPGIEVNPRLVSPPEAVTVAIDSNAAGLYAALPARNESYFVRLVKLEVVLNLVTATVYLFPFTRVFIEYPIAFFWLRWDKGIPCLVIAVTNASKVLTDVVVVRCLNPVAT